MIRPTPEILRAIEMLKSNPHWETFAKWIRDSWGEIVLEQSALSTNPSKFPYDAGRSKEVKEILNTIEKAGGK